MVQKIGHQNVLNKNGLCSKAYMECQREGVVLFKGEERNGGIFPAKTIAYLLLIDR